MNAVTGAPPETNSTSSRPRSSGSNDAQTRSTLTDWPVVGSLQPRSFDAIASQRLRMSATGVWGSGASSMSTGGLPRRRGAARPGVPPRRDSGRGAGGEDEHDAPGTVSDVADR